MKSRNLRAVPTTDSEPGYDGLPGKLSQDQLAKLEESLGELGLSSLLQTPRRRLTDAALGRAQVDLKDVEGLVATHLLSSDALASTLAEHTRDLVAFFFAQTGSKKKQQPNAEAILLLAERVARLHSNQLAEVRRTAELLVRIGSPRPQPRVQLVAAVQAENVNVGCR